LADLGEIFAELRRRRVFRALLGWGIASFAILQIVEPVMHAYHLPEWTLTVVVTVLAAGFPITVILSWIYDLTATGVIRTAAPSWQSRPWSARARTIGLLLGLGLAAAAPGLVYFFVWPGAARVHAPAGPAKAASAEIPSIAVLPFVNLSSDREQEYFSDGITDEILNELAQVKGLRVIGRTSSFSMKGKNEDLRVIGQRLGATNLLEGSVRKAGTRVRITAQLVEATGGSHLWSQEFDRDLTDVFGVQEEIARAVAAALRLRLLPGQAEPAHRADPAAHDQYLLGVAYLARGSGPSYEQAVKVLRRSVSLDPGYAQAWAALAMALFWHADQASGGDVASEWPEALAAAEKSIALAPDHAEGYQARGLVREGAHQDWEGARSDLEKARSLSPQNPAVLSQTASLLAALGNLTEAIPLLEQAATIDPLSPDIGATLSAVYLGTGQLPLAEAAARRALETSPDHGRAARNLGFALLLQGRNEEARQAFQRSSNPLFVHMGNILVAHALGHDDEARRGLAKLLEGDRTLQASYQVAQIHAWMGDVDRAFDWLRRAVTAHDAGLLYVKYDPILKPLRADPRYAALLSRLKLPPG
jgi:serine/threonine-protein kinase